MVKLDIACGQRKAKGFKGIDLAGDADIVHDLFVFPWPIKDNSVTEVACNHFIEHVPHYRPEWPKDGWWMFFEEIHRICKNGAPIHITHPYVKSDRAFWDPTHVRFIHDMTWQYLSKEWREAQGLDHYDTDCDFEVLPVVGTGIAQEFVGRSAETMAYNQSHLWNTVADLAVELKVRK